MSHLWVGLDCGHSHMGLAVLDETDRVLAIERTSQPSGDGHSREIALARLNVLLDRVSHLKGYPAILAGYCYEHSGVCEAFRDAGWRVVGLKALNDVVGIYGLTDMRGNTVAGGCGSFPQVVYVDRTNSIRWPGEDVVAEMPGWPLSGWNYAELLLSLSQRDDLPEIGWVRQEVLERLGGERLEQSSDRWGSLGPLLPRVLDCPDVRQFLATAAHAVLTIRDVMWRYAAVDDPPCVVIGGGAVEDERVWNALQSELRARSLSVKRVVGEPAVGLARYARRFPDADAWAVIGQVRPCWLS